MIVVLDRFFFDAKISEDINSRAKEEKQTKKEGGGEGELPYQTKRINFRERKINKSSKQETGKFQREKENPSTRSVLSRTTTAETVERREKHEILQNYLSLCSLLISTSKITGKYI